MEIHRETEKLVDKEIQIETWVDYHADRHLRL